MQEPNSTNSKPRIQKFVPHKTLQEIREQESPYHSYVDFDSGEIISPNQLQLVTPDKLPAGNVTPSATQTAYLQARVNQARRLHPPEPDQTVVDPVGVTAQIQAKIDAQKKK